MNWHYHILWCWTVVWISDNPSDSLQTFESPCVMLGCWYVWNTMWRTRSHTYGRISWSDRSRNRRIPILLSSTSLPWHSLRCKQRSMGVQVRMKNRHRWLWHSCFFKGTNIGGCWSKSNWKASVSCFSLSSFLSISSINLVRPSLIFNAACISSYSSLIFICSFASSICFFSWRAFANNSTFRWFIF